MDQFPRMLYRAGGPEALHGGYFSTLIVKDESEQDAALADGWALSTPEALEQKAAAEAPKPAESDDSAPPTRAELEQKATELGIKFDGRTGDKKLAELIAAKLKG